MMRQQLTLTENLHTGASDTVAAASTAVGDVQTNPGGDQLILKLAYTKGTEDGLLITVVFPSTPTDTDLYTQGAYMDLGTGVQRYRQMIFEFTASATTDIPIDLRNRTYYRVYQVRSGAVAANGTFTLKQQVYG